MKINTARFSICTACQNQFNICSHCDRGNIYCSSNCSFLMRKKFRKIVVQRYQASKNGRIHHAARQRRYRAAQRSFENKVTHSGSKPLAFHDLLPANKSDTTQFHTPVKDANIYCCFCGKPCSKFVRQDYLRGILNVKKEKTSLWPRAP